MGDGEGIVLAGEGYWVSGDGNSSRRCASREGREGTAFESSEPAPTLHSSSCGFLLSLNNCEVRACLRVESRSEKEDEVALRGFSLSPSYAHSCFELCSATTCKSSFDLPKSLLTSRSERSPHTDATAPSAAAPPTAPTSAPASAPAAGGEGDA